MAAASRRKRTPTGARPSDSPCRAPDAPENGSAGAPRGSLLYADGLETHSTTDPTPRPCLPVTPPGGTGKTPTGQDWERSRPTLESAVASLQQSWARRARRPLGFVRAGQRLGAAAVRHVVHGNDLEGADHQAG